MLHKFIKEKHRRYTECDRMPIYNGDYSSFEFYYEWLDEAKEMLEKYKKEEISADEMMQYLNG